MDELLRSVCRDRLMERTAEIASEVRLSGSEAELRAFRRIEAALEEMGLRPQLTFHDALISLPGEAHLTVLPANREVPCITHSFAAPSPLATVGEVQYVRSTDEAMNLTGKIALLDGVATPASMAWAEECGALGQIFANDMTEDLIHEMTVSPVWGSPTPEDIERLPQTPSLSISRADGRQLKEELEGRGSLWARMKTEVSTGWKEIPRLVVDIPAAGVSDFVLVSGHVDSWHYGAMDNGSANATMLELAELLSQKADDLLRGVRIAFWSGHSHGRYAGSAHYADANWGELHRHCVVHINVDSTGGRGASVIGEAPVLPQTRHVASEVIEKLTGAELSGKLLGRAGDHSFLGMGVPALFMNVSEQPASSEGDQTAFSSLFGASDSSGGRGGGLGWWWHTPQDTLDKVDGDNLVRDTRIYLAATWRFATDPILPLRYSDLALWMRDSVTTVERDAPSEKLRAIGTALDTLCELLRDIEAAADEGGVPRDEYNELLVRLGHYLVPVALTGGDPFDVDPALPQKPIPSLDATRRLSQMPPGSDEWYSQRIASVRGLNRLEWAVSRASEIVGEGLRGSSIH
ncbi:MAG: M28 family peptidase [Bacillota bacterium]